MPACMHKSLVDHSFFSKTVIHDKAWTETGLPGSRHWLPGLTTLDIMKVIRALMSRRLYEKFLCARIKIGE